MLAGQLYIKKSVVNLQDPGSVNAGICNQNWASKVSSFKPEIAGESRAADKTF